MAIQYQLFSNQRGAVLIFVLVILTVLTLAGASSTRNTALQERMTAHTRDRATAFESSEAMLRSAERWLATELKAGRLNDSHFTSRAKQGLYDITTSTNKAPSINDALHDDSLWTDNPPMALHGVIQAPRFMVERIPPEPSLMFGEAVEESKILYRITVQGFGASAQTYTVLQSIYR